MSHEKDVTSASFDQITGVCCLAAVPQVHKNIVSLDRV